ncbi:MAG: AI-2E family transporter [Fervidobacterium pennivorans]|uniref:AI-2E family transporter n=1 Tax=Fervidobacterium sp. TaxID=1871331 RepID=UPI00259D4F73|nr:AI-2E family transporter [Fervidobacterium sp.]MDM7320954.1 AI-2E family transporter [Fervidobacterium sp.]NPU89531.1 AI-2E family transporter [Fervidobacterium sp.]
MKESKKSVADNIKAEKVPYRDMLLVLFYFLLFIFFAWKVPFVIGALVLGYYFSVILSVPYDYVLKKTGKRFPAIASYVFVIAIFVYAIASFFPLVINQINSVIQSAQSASLNLDLPAWALKYLDEFKSNISSFLAQVIKYVANILPSLFTMVVLLIVTMAGVESIRFYFKEKVHLLFIDDPKYGEHFVVHWFNNVKRYLRGQVLVSFISASLTTVGLYIIGVPSALTLGILSFIGGFFPFVGLLLTAVPMYLLAFTSQGIKGMVWLTVVLVAVNQTESWFYGPKIQSSNLKIHWFVILLSIFILGSVLGFVGVLLALPILIFIRDYWNFYVLKLRTEK